MNNFYSFTADESLSTKKWKRVVINEILTRYETNQNGIVRDIYINDKKNFYKSPSCDSDIVFLKVGRRYISILRKRIIAGIFVPIPDRFQDRDQSSLYVNFIDTCKENIYTPSNLEWKSMDEIAEKRGVSAYNTYSKETIIRVCELLMENKLPFKKIEEITGVSISTISNIYKKKKHARITQDYEFPKRYNCYTENNRNRYSDKQIHHVCRLLKYTNLKCRQIVEITGVNRSTIYGIKNHTWHTDISDHYDI